MCTELYLQYTPTNWLWLSFCHILFHAHMRTAYNLFRQWSHYLYERVVIMRICGQNYTYIIHTNQLACLCVPYFIPCAYAHSLYPQIVVSYYLYERVVVMRICGQNYTYIQYTPTNWLSQCSMFYSMRICAQPGQQMATFRLSEKKRASDLVKKKRATRMKIE